MGGKQSRRLAVIEGHPTSSTAGCGKARYTEAQAADVVERARHRRALRAYRCVACDAWHVASER